MQLTHSDYPDVGTRGTPIPTTLKLSGPIDSAMKDYVSLLHTIIKRNGLAVYHPHSD